MRVNILLGLCLGSGLLLASSAALAQTAQVDPETGNLVSGADVDPSNDGVLSAQAQRSASAGQVRVVDLESGAKAIEFTDAQLKYLVLTIDEQGNRILSHQSKTKVDAEGIEEVNVAREDQ